MKQFLRYQISGSVFILWVLIFHFGNNEWNLLSLAKNLTTNLNSSTLAASLALAMPLGVLIHQFSVIIKNWIFGFKNNFFSDFPVETNIKKIKNNNQIVTYCFERISNLNSFYYVRFDNGFLSPFLAFVATKCFLSGVLKWRLIVFASSICIITVMYIPKILIEMRKYQKIINELSDNED